MSLSTDQALEATLYNVQIRSVVEETLQSMLMDVEVAVSLERELQQEEEINNLKQRAIANEMALKEARLVDEKQETEKKSLADELVQELWTLSQELGRLKRWKKEQEKSVEERDELMAKLLQAQDEIQQLNSRPVQPVEDVQDSPDTNEEAKSVADGAAVLAKRKDPPPGSTTSISQSNEIDAPITIEQEQPPSSSAAVASGEQEATQETSKSDVKESPTAQPPSPAVAIIPEEEQNTDKGGDPDAISPLLQEEPPPPAAVVSLVEDEDVPQLETFEEPILLNVFAYLDALEIVNLAQVNIGLYSRVDSLFGIGSEVVPVPKQISTPAPVQPSATIVALPPARGATSAPAAKPKPTPAASQTKGIISLFQTSRQTPPRKAREKSPPRSTAASQQQQQQPLSAAMANSMAAKLTDKEINAIISMTEKLNQRNVQVESLSKTNTDLTGKLEGTEAVKEFLVSKVRELESRQNRNQELEIKTTQQIASDQEVIGFLDSRVQELERNERSLLKDKKTASDQLTSVKVSKEQKITVLSDMLQYEREKLAEAERDWKSTRKVLVKEVKNCRVQIMALQAERDGLKEQNDRLKKAVLATNAINGNL